MLAQCQSQKELLCRHGLADHLLDDQAAAVAQFEASVAETNEGRQDHVLARAELERVSEEGMQLVGMLDGLNRYRFAREPQLLRAWESARHVATGPQAEQKAITPSRVPAPAGPGEAEPAA
jgi:hypothetical protein